MARSSLSSVAHLFGAESDLIIGGLLGFSPVLTAIALGTVFYQPSPRVAAYAALGTVFTVVAQAAFNVALTPFAIPALTAPFVLVSWIFLLPRQSFDHAASGQAEVLTAGASIASDRVASAWHPPRASPRMAMMTGTSTAATMPAAKPLL